MAFSTFCTNKGCGKIQEPYIDPKDDKVYCSHCDGELTNITHFVKVQMKSMKQYKPKSAKPFAVKCEVCGKEEQPVVLKDNVVCGACHGPLKALSPIFKNMLKEKLRTVNKDV
jgi:Zn finger protein HypA/HybF involved in hydrogenase expression